MAGTTRLFMVGNLTKDPTLTMTQSGRAKCGLNVAVNTSFKDKKGEWQEKADFYFVDVWGPAAERCARDGRKGDQVTIDGHLGTWKPEGEQYAKTQLIADFVFLPQGAGKRAPADQGSGDFGDFGPDGFPDEF